MENWLQVSYRVENWIQVSYRVENWSLLSYRYYIGWEIDLKYRIGIILGGKLEYHDHKWPFFYYLQKEILVNKKLLPL